MTRPERSQRRRTSRQEAHAEYRAAVKAARRARAVAPCPLSSLSPGAVVDARIEFEDAPERWKWRPVVVLSTRAEGFVVAPCTTVARPGPRQLTLVDWQPVGLARPTDVVLRPRTISRSDLGAVRGQLTARDEGRLLAVLRVVNTVACSVVTG